MAPITTSVCSVVIRTPSGKGLRHGIVANAVIHVARSAAGSRWTVPRGPKVLTSVRSCHSARRTSARVAPSMRSAAEISAADRTCACTPTVAAATSAGSVPEGNGVVSPCCPSRRALTAAQVVIAAHPGRESTLGSGPHGPRPFPGREPHEPFGRRVVGGHPGVASERGPAATPRRGRSGPVRVVPGAASRADVPGGSCPGPLPGRSRAGLVATRRLGRPGLSRLRQATRSADDHHRDGCRAPRERVPQRGAGRSGGRAEPDRPRRRGTRQPRGRAAPRRHLLVSGGAGHPRERRARRGPRTPAALVDPQGSRAQALRNRSAARAPLPHAASRG